MLGRGGYCGLRQQQQARRTSQVVGAPKPTSFPRKRESRGRGGQPLRNRRTKVSTAQVGTRRRSTREEQVSTHDLSHGDARSRSGRTVYLPGTRLSGALDGRGYSTSKRNNRAMTGATPEGRRSGDVGGAGILTNLQPTFRTRPQPRGDPSTNTRRTESSPKGRIKRVYERPLSGRTGTRASEARS